MFLLKYSQYIFNLKKFIVVYLKSNNRMFSTQFLFEKDLFVKTDGL